MDRRTFVQLAGIRFRLQWARARRSPGKRALFVILQAIVVVIILVVAITGLAGAITAAAAGQIESSASLLLWAPFLNALVASVLLGYGMNQVLSDATLRRYPLSARDRLVVRHALGLFEPTWLITFALYAGAAVGLALVGPATIWLAVPTAVLLAASTYLMARALVSAIERASETRRGQFVLFLLLQGIAFGPAIARAVSGRVPRVVGDVLRAVAPPQAATAALVGSGTVWDIGVLVAWPLAAFGALMLVDTREHRRAATTRTTAMRDGAIDWIAARLPGVSAPLAARTLRYYLRGYAVRSMLIGTLPLLTYLIVQFSEWEPKAVFVSALSLSPAIGAFVTIQLDVNTFGYDRFGFARLFLGPIRPADVLRAVVVAPMVIGAAYIPLVLGAWIVLSPIPVEPAMIAMIAGGAIAGLCGLRGIAVWASIGAPRVADYDERFRNQTTWAGNIVMLGAMAGMAIVGFLAARFDTTAAILTYWWLAPIAAALAAAFFAVSLRSAERAFARHRERLLAVMEGKA